MPQRKCWIDNCHSESARLGMCELHANLWDLLVRNQPKTKLYGKTDVERYDFYLIKDPSPEIQRHFGAEPDCWVWRGTLNHHGYGLMRSAFSERGNGQQVHLFVLSEVLGLNLIKDQETDHLCRFRPCSNPDHLERVGGDVNKLRGIGFGAKNAAKTHCDNGHEFTPDNTYLTVKGWRGCRECRRVRLREYSSRSEVKAARLEAYVPKTGVRGKGQYQTQRDTCKDGHKLEGENLIQEKKIRNGVVSYVRRCRTCRNAKARSSHAKRTGSK